MKLHTNMCLYTLTLCMENCLRELTCLQYSFHCSLETATVTGPLFKQGSIMTNPVSGRTLVWSLSGFGWKTDVGRRSTV
jgi:hypothetical protein